MTRGNHQIIVGNCLEELKKLPTESVHCCVTSPPYFALRSYLPADHPDKTKEIGNEPTPEAFIATMVDVFREVRRVLRDDGYCWINLGDSYSSSGGHTAAGSSGFLSTMEDQSAARNRGTYDLTASSGLKTGNQLLVPHRVALALQSDGWILRDTAIWAKTSPMPSSQNGTRWERCQVKVKSKGQPQNHTASIADYKHNQSPPHPNNSIVREPTEWIPCPGCKKCEKTGGWILRKGQGRYTTAHEYLFLLTKTNKYFWDMENCREPTTDRIQTTYKRPNKEDMSTGPMSRGTEGFNHQFADPNRVWGDAGTRIPRSVLTLSNEPTKFKHFATFPSALVKFCLNPLSPKGCCPTCKTQWAPVVESERVATRPATNNKRSGADAGNCDPERHITSTNVIGYRPACSCETQNRANCTVLDPFSGIATTGQTACFLGHDYIGIELNQTYANFSEEWITKEPRWSIREKIRKPLRKHLKTHKLQKPLFQ